MGFLSWKMKRTMLSEGTRNRHGSVFVLAFQWMEKSEWALPLLFYSITPQCAWDAHFCAHGNSSAGQCLAVGLGRAESQGLTLLPAPAKLLCNRAAPAKSGHQEHAKHLEFTWKNCFKGKNEYIFSLGSDVKRLVLTYRWIWPCGVCACMLKTASRFSTECIIFARFIFLSGGWSPDYTVSFCCRSCWSLQKKIDGNVETVVLLFCGARKDAPACRFVLCDTQLLGKCCETGLRGITRTRQQSWCLVNL